MSNIIIIPEDNEQNVTVLIDSTTQEIIVEILPPQEIIVEVSLVGDKGDKGDPGEDLGTSDHTELTNIGTNTHPQIDTHIADETIHFTQAQISITESQISDLGDYEPADPTILKDADIGVTVQPYNVDTTVQGVITLESLGGTTDHTQLSNIGTNTHPQIDTHIADETIHFTQAQISITESQISDLKPYLENVVEDLTPELGGNLNALNQDIINIKELNFNGGQSISWNDFEHTIDVTTGLGPIIQVGLETLVHVYNNSGVTIMDGKAVYPLGPSTGGLPHIGLAISSSHETIINQVGVTTGEILPGTDGFVTLVGTIRNINTSGLTTGPVYVSSTIAGDLTSVKPEFPNYAILMGVALTIDAVIGSMVVDIRNDVYDTFNNFHNGTIREPFSFPITSDGTTITGTLTEKIGTKLTLSFSDGFTTLITPKTIIIPQGTDTVPKDIYIYILSSTKALAYSEVGFPTNVEHIKIAYVLVQTATEVLASGPIMNHNYNDEVQDEYGQGHLSHITDRLRQESAKYSSGIDYTNTVTLTSNQIAVTGGIVYQLHKQNYAAKNMATGDNIYVVNHFTTPFLKTTNLNTIINDALGTTLFNSSFSFVVWGVVNSGGQVGKLMVNLPTGKYPKNAPATALSDPNNFSVYSVPKEFKSTAFLIERVTYTRETNGDWILYAVEDLRGTPIGITGGTGGGIGGSGVTTFSALTDTPSSYIGFGGQLVIVDPSEAGLNYVEAKTSNLENDGEDGIHPFISALDLPTNTSDFINDGATGVDRYVEFEELATLIPSLPQDSETVLYIGDVIWISGLTFYVYATKYKINGVLREGLISATVTLGAADVTFGRIDSFIIQNDGLGDLISNDTIAVIPGIPTSEPAKQVLNNELQLEVSFATIAANATEPTVPFGLSVEVIYAENIEWTITGATGTINAASTSLPITGTVSILHTYPEHQKSIYFSNVTPKFTNSNAVLQFDIKLQTVWEFQNRNGTTIDVYLWNGNNRFTGRVRVGSDLGLNFDPYNITTVQTVYIRLDRFANLFNSNTYNKIQFQYQRTQADIFRIDNIKVVEGYGGSSQESTDVPTKTSQLLNDGEDSTSTYVEWDEMLATNVSVDAVGFNGNLGVDDDTVQKVAQKLDDLISGDMFLANIQIVSGLKTFLYDKLGMRNAANTFTSFFRNANTAIRYYTLPNKDGTVAMTSDIIAQLNGTVGRLVKFGTSVTGVSSRLWDTGTFFGIGTVNTPTKDITLGNQANREIGVELSESSYSGRDLIVSAGKTINYLLTTVFTRLNVSIVDIGQVNGLGVNPNNNDIHCAANGKWSIRYGGVGDFIYQGLFPGTSASDIEILSNGDMYCSGISSGRVWRKIGAGAWTDVMGFTGYWGRLFYDSVANDLYVFVSDGYDATQSRVWANMTTWVLTTEHTTPAPLGILQMAKHPNGDIYAVGNSKYYIRTLGSNTYTEMNDAPTAVCKTITIAPNGTIYLAGISTVASKVMGGPTWVSEVLNTGGATIRDIQSDVNGNIYVVPFSFDIFYKYTNATGAINLDGGTLIHKAGTGKGTGKSRYQIITGQKTASGTDMQLETVRAEFDEDGNMQLLAYGQGAKGGVAAYGLGLDATGKLVETTAIGGAVRPTTRITNAAVTGTYTLDHSLASDWKLTLIGATVIDESNLPTGTDTIEFTMKVTGNFGLTVPAYWNVVGDAYDGMLWNFYAVQIHKGDATQEATAFLTNL